MNPMRDKVQVAVRLRPLLKRELGIPGQEQSYWSVSPTSITQCIDDKPIPFHSFSFDHIFLPDTTNESVFDAVARPVVASAIDGINGVIFAYGQTAAGKTYTMLGKKADPGITLRSISDVFERISKLPSRKFLLRASYIEIYNENIRDLLVPSNDNLKIHEDVVTNMVYVNSHRKVVTSVDDVMKIISAGEAVRAIGATNMNEKASRSHTIFTVSIESREILRSDSDSTQKSGVAVRNSSLALVDLAGSERASLTKAHGKRLTEGGYINKSLLTLGTVIKKLSSESSRATVHIPYRDSKLTRLLQPALGGNARTVIICAVTTAAVHMEETLSTLKFASRAKHVTNHAETNEFLDDRAKLKRAERQIASLKKEMKRLRGTLAASVSQADTEAHIEGNKQSRGPILEETLSEIISMVQKMGDECPKCSMPVSAEILLQREEKVRLLKTLIESSSRNIPSESQQTHPETVETLFTAVRQLQDKLAVKEMELGDLERQLESFRSSDEMKNRLEYASDHEKPMSVCTSDETLTQKSLDSSTCSDGSSVERCNTTEMLKELRRSFGEKKIELENMFTKLNLLRTESEREGHMYSTIVEGISTERKAIPPTGRRVYLEGKQSWETSKAEQYLQTGVAEETELKIRISSGGRKSDLKLTAEQGDEVAASELARGEGRLSKLTSVFKRVLIASCAIWVHCGLARLLNFGTNRGLVGVCMGNVTDCPS